MNDHYYIAMWRILKFSSTGGEFIGTKKYGERDNVQKGPFGTGLSLVGHHVDEQNEVLEDSFQ